MLGMSGRALSFGVMAEAYERFRPGYPVALFDMVMAYAAQPVRTALEIGAGTGKATRLFAGRGIAVTATEPDEAMLAELRERVFGRIIEVLPETVEIIADITVHLARRRGEPRQ
ncbi:methyltransferase domain-containing protein [Streptosporangium sp. NPDC002721]|uniref:methyltransferase domain-containing protein n=1 Tax=Streptosporangium sp. NPDC002721 TaxID=3366188 RepID=UPI0036C203CD